MDLGLKIFNLVQNISKQDLIKLVTIN